MSVSRRTCQNQGCPNHKSISTTEELLIAIFNHMLDGFKKYNIPNLKWSSNGSPVEIDIYNPKPLLAIEYDGEQHDSIERQLTDQEKNKMLSDNDYVKIFIRIREAGMPKLTYFPNQYEITCDPHHYSYKFLIPAIQQTLYVIKKNYALSIMEYSNNEIHLLINRLLPTVDGAKALMKNRNPFSKYAPGLLRYLDEDNREPNFVPCGSTHPFNVTCPNCSFKFPENKSRAKKLIYSKGLCPKCLHFVEDIVSPNYKKIHAPFGTHIE